jgi:hypothetical protein
VRSVNACVAEKARRLARVIAWVEIYFDGVKASRLRAPLRPEDPRRHHERQNVVEHSPAIGWGEWGDVERLQRREGVTVIL